MSRWLDRAPGIPEPGKRERGGEGGKEKEEDRSTYTTSQTPCTYSTKQSSWTCLSSLIIITIYQLNTPGPHHPPLNQPQRILQRAKHAMPFPNPAADTNEIYLLSSSSGSHMLWLHATGGYVPHPPYDLVVVSKMMREFTSPLGLNMQKERNVYFHFHLKCLRRQQQLFLPLSIRVPPMIYAELSQPHVIFLRSFGVLV